MDGRSHPIPHQRHRLPTYSNPTDIPRISLDRRSNSPHPTSVASTSNLLKADRYLQNLPRSVVEIPPPYIGGTSLQSTNIRPTSHLSRSKCKRMSGIFDRILQCNTLNFYTLSIQKNTLQYFHSMEEVPLLAELSRSLPRSSSSSPSKFNVRSHIIRWLSSGGNDGTPLS